MDQQVQAMLNSICSDPGAILVRTETGWAALLRGAAGYQLTMNPVNNLPDWIAPAAGGPGTSNLERHCMLAISTAFTQAVNWFQMTPYFIAKGSVVDAIQFYARAASATTKVTPAIYDLVSNVPTNLVKTGPDVIGVNAGLNTLPLSAPHVALFDQIVFPGVQVRTATFSTSQGTNLPVCYFAASGALPATAPATTFTVGGSDLVCWPTKL